MGRKKNVLLENPEELIDKKTRKNLDNVITKYLNKKHDFTILIVADKTGVGMGKSVLSHIMCAYVDKKLKRFRYTPEFIFFDADDFRMKEPDLKPLDSFSFDEPDAFFSTEAMTRAVRHMKIKFAHIRQRRHFICLCAPNPMMLTSWFRPGGQSRVNVLIRIVRRGTFYAYTMKTGTMNAINMDRRKHRIKWPRADYIGFFNKIPEDSDFWKAYIKKKEQFLTHKDGNTKTIEMIRENEKRRKKSLTLREISEIHAVTTTTAKGWIDIGIFDKKGVWKDMSGRMRIEMTTYKRGMELLKKRKEDPTLNIDGSKRTNVKTICPSCRKKKKIFARNMCRSCYGKWYRAQKKKRARKK